MRYEYLLILIALFGLGVLLLLKLSTYKEGFADVPSIDPPGLPSSQSNYLSSIGTPTGGMAEIPVPAGSSNAPNTMPGSTTANSSIALAAFKDLSDLLESMTTFNTLYENNLASGGSNAEYSSLYTTGLADMSKIKKQIDTQTVVDTLDYITGQRVKYRDAITVIRNTPSNSNANNSPPVTNLSAGETITLSDIRYAITRAQTEQTRIESLRSSAPDLSARSQILERVRLGLTDLVDKIDKGYRATDNLPFTKAELTQFLSDVSDPSSTVRPIPKPPTAQGAAQDVAQDVAQGATQAATQGATQGAAGYDTTLQQLQSVAQDLTWDISIRYDPNVTIQRRILDRLQQLSSDIKSNEIGSPELAAKMFEINVLQQQITTYNRRRVAESSDPLQAYQAADVAPVSAPTTLSEAFEGARAASFNPSPSNDWRIRPGSEMTTDAIVHRASSSSYTDTASGPDYKKRVEFLCKQIRGAELGDPKEFGCIANPESDVGPDYSWRGNYKMVCNRLGNTWGGWYPEMFGCPPSNIATPDATK